MVGAGRPASPRLRWFLPLLLVPSWSTGAVLAHTITLAPGDVERPAGLASLVHRPTFRRRPRGPCRARGPAGLSARPVGGHHGPGHPGATRASVGGAAPAGPGPCRSPACGFPHARLSPRPARV